MPQLFHSLDKVTHDDIQAIFDSMAEIGQSTVSKLYRPLWVMQTSKPRWIDIHILCMRTWQNSSKSAPIVTRL